MSVTRLQALNESLATWLAAQRAVGPRTSLLAVVCAGLTLLAGVSGCAGPPGAAADGYASARVQTWHDVDGDGERDPGESPVPWVTIQLAYELAMTDSSGEGQVGVFKPGCARACWKGESVSVRVPPGYRATTPTEAALTGQESTYHFGLQPERGAGAQSLPGEPGWFRAFASRGLDLLAFHYAADEESLAVSFEAASGDLDGLYWDVFDVILSLKKMGEISVERVAITLLPAGEVAVCDISELQAWTGRISPSEIVSTRCQRAQRSTATPLPTLPTEPTSTQMPEPTGAPAAFEGRWCFDSEGASLDLQLAQAGDRLSGSFFLLKYCEVEGERSACRIREGEIAGLVRENRAEISLKIPEYDDAGTVLLVSGADSLSWEVQETPQEYYLPARFSLNRCRN